MPNRPMTLWQQFSAAFVDAVRGQPDAAIIEGWTTLAPRTQWYASTIMPSVASRLDLELQYELLAIDYVLSESTVPLVFVESENDAFSIANDELRKLCSAAGPLKVLITCVEWSDAPGDWPSGGFKASLLADWARVIERHHDRWPQEHVFGICVAEMCRSRFRVYTQALGADGAVVDAEAVALERQIRR